MVTTISPNFCRTIEKVRKLRSHVFLPGAVLRRRQDDDVEREAEPRPDFRRELRREQERQGGAENGQLPSGTNPMNTCNL